MKRSKRLLVLVLSVMMVLTTFPLPAFAGEAEEAEAIPEEAVIQQEEISEAEQVPEAVEAAPEAAPAEAPAVEPAEPEKALAEAPAEEAVPAEKPAKAEPAAEDPYPAVVLQKKVGGVTVTLTAPEGALPEGASLKVKAVDRADVAQAVAEELESQGKTLTDLVAFDVTPVDKDGKEIQPKKEVSVSFEGTSLDVAKDGDVDVFRVSDDAKTVTPMDTDVASGDAQVFDTDHFTIYVSTGSATNTNGNGTNNSRNDPYVLEYGDEIQLVSTDGAGSGGYRPWQPFAGNTTDSNYQAYYDFTLIDGYNCKVKNHNPNSADVIVVIRHTLSSAYGDDNYTYYYVQLEPRKYEVNFKVQMPGQTEFEQKGRVTVRYNTTANVPSSITSVLEQDGRVYKLDGWYTDESCATKASLSNITQDKTVYAKYVDAHKITYDINGMDWKPVDMPPAQAAETGESVGLAGIVGGNPEFKSWNTEPDGSGDSYSAGGTMIMPDEDVVLYAQWEYTISYNANGGQDAPESQKFIGKTTQTLSSGQPTREGYTFKGWATDKNATAAEYQPGDTLTPEALYTYLYAVWEADEYTISYDLDGGSLEAGKTNPETYNVETNTFTLNNPVKDGYKFGGWTGTDLTDPAKTVRVAKGSTGDREYTANWIELTDHELTVEMPEAGKAISSSPFPEVTDSVEDSDLTHYVWVADEEELAKEVATASGTFTRYEQAPGNFEAGETYYSLVVLEFPEDETADVSRVKLVETDDVKKAGDAVLIEAANSVIVPFAVTIPAITVTVEFGSGHEAAAAAAAAASEDVTMTANGSTLTYKAQKGSDRWYDVTSPLRRVLFSIDRDDNGERMYNGFVPYNLKPLTDYADEEAWEADAEEAMDSVPQNEDLTLYVQWMKPTGAALSIEAPVCGTEIVDNDGSEPAPEVTITGGNVEMMEGALLYWVEVDDSGIPKYPFEGTVEGGETYTAMVNIRGTFGYYIDESDVTVEGGEVTLPQGFEGTLVIIDVVAEHDWGEPAYEWSEDNSECTATCACKADPTHKTEQTVKSTKEVKEPTCEEGGETVYTAVFEKPFETQTKTTDPTDATGHDWDTENVEITWSGDNSECTATVICKNDPSHELSETVKTDSEVTKEPTTTSWGETTYTANFTDETLAEAVGDQNTKTVKDIEPITYEVVEGEGQTWTKGSGVSADFHIERSYKDEETYGLFTGIKVDGKVVPASEYKTEEGSVIIKIQPAYLETLANGEHTLTAEFEDGSVDTTFIVEGEDKAAGGGAKTGDDANTGLWSLLLAVSLLVMTGTAAVSRRKREER